MSESASRDPGREELETLLAEAIEIAERGGPDSLEEFLAEQTDRGEELRVQGGLRLRTRRLDDGLPAEHVARHRRR